MITSGNPVKSIYENRSKYFITVEVYKINICLGGFYVIQKTEGLYIESRVKRGFYESPEIF